MDFMPILRFQTPQIEFEISKFSFLDLLDPKISFPDPKNVEKLGSGLEIEFTVRFLCSFEVFTHLAVLLRN